MSKTRRAPRACPSFTALISSQLLPDACRANSATGLVLQAVHFVILAAESQISESVTPGTDLDRHQFLGIDRPDRAVYQAGAY